MSPSVWGTGGRCWSPLASRLFCFLERRKDQRAGGGEGGRGGEEKRGRQEGRGGRPRAGTPCIGALRQAAHLPHEVGTSFPDSGSELGGSVGGPVPVTGLRGGGWWAPCRGLQRAAPATLRPPGRRRCWGLAGGQPGGWREPQRVQAGRRGLGALRGPPGARSSRTARPRLLSQRPALQTLLSHFTDGHTESERSRDRPQPGSGSAPGHRSGVNGQTPREALSKLLHRPASAGGGRGGRGR